MVVKFTLHEVAFAVAGLCPVCACRSLSRLFFQGSLTVTRAQTTVSLEKSLLPPSYDVGDPWILGISLVSKGLSSM